MPDKPVSFPAAVTPKAAGYYFPAEFAPHRATWLSWPHKEASWPGKIHTIYPSYAKFIAELVKGEDVCINVADEVMQQQATTILQQQGVHLSRVRFFLHPTNDAWCRDHGPIFVRNAKTGEVAVTDWVHNAWGGKYPPYDLDNRIPPSIAQKLGMRRFENDMVLEGGSIDVNGEGLLLTSEQCLLNKNRNPHLSRGDIEQNLKDYLGVKQVLWVGEGIVGDDTARAGDLAAGRNG